MSPGASANRGHTSGLVSSNFTSVTVNHFVDVTQEKFIRMVGAMAPHVNLSSSVLELSIVLGGGHTMASTLTCDPTTPSVPLGHAADSEFIFSLIGNRTTQFMADIRHRFQEVVNNLFSLTVVLIVDVRLGDGHHRHVVLRLHPEPMPLPSPSSPGGDSPSNHGGHDHDGDGAARPPCAVMLTRAGGPGHVNSTLSDAPESRAVHFAAPPPGAVAEFFAGFNPSSANPNASIAEETHDDDGGDDNDIDVNESADSLSTEESDLELVSGHGIDDQEKMS